MVFKWIARARLPLVMLIVAAVTWSLSPGLPVRSAPVAAAGVAAAGQQLFTHEWAVNDPLARGDGLGPVYNATSCAQCHFQGGIGGGGDQNSNVFAFEIHPNIRDGGLRQGLVHAYAVSDQFREDEHKLRECFPIIPGGERLIGGCTVRIEDFDPISTHQVNSTALFGAGWIDRIDPKAIKHNRMLRVMGEVSREIRGDFQTTPPGRVRILPDGRVGKFGWKAQFATLQEFVAVACANELGLGNPLLEQAQPLGSDYKCEQMDLENKQFQQLVAFVDTLPRPRQVLPTDSTQLAQVQRGQELFSTIGCAACHTPQIGGVAGVYSDFLLHNLTSPEDDGYRHEILVEVPVSATHPEPQEWKTPPLWGVADSAPYMHDGGSPTLQHAIGRHKGQASRVTRRYQDLPGDDQNAIIAFLKSLKAPAEAIPIDRVEPVIQTVSR